MKCEQCSIEFTPRQKTQKFCSKTCKTEYNKYCDNTCGVCGVTFRGVKGRKYCSTECRSNSIRETRICKMCGDEFTERVKHHREMCSDKCRVEWSNIPENREKQKNTLKQTVINKYGVNHVWESPKIHEKTMVNRDRLLSIQRQKNTVKTKHLIKLHNRLKSNDLSLIDDYTTNKNGNQSIHYTFNCGVCDTTFTSTVLGSGKVPICRTCNPLIQNPKWELEVEKYLNDNNITYIKNTRELIKPLEVDFYIPSCNLAIELNGLYWHGESNGKDKNYHLNKTKMCYEKGVKLIHIFEDEYVNKKDIVFSRLGSLLNINHDNRIYARKSVVKEITYNVKKNFLDNNHLQGDTKSSINLGLYHKDTLVSVMTLGKRKMTGGDVNWELIRFSSKINHSVIGGFSKLLKHFKMMGVTDNLMTYSDIRWSGFGYLDTVYQKNGFNYIKHTEPNYWYCKSGYNTREHRYNYRKDILVKRGFEKDKTESQIMVEDGFDRVWDCGTMKFTINL